MKSGEVSSRTERSGWPHCYASAAAGFRTSMHISHWGLCLLRKFPATYSQFSSARKANSEPPVIVTQNRDQVEILPPINPAPDGLSSTFLPCRNGHDRRSTLGVRRWRPTRLSCWDFTTQACTGGLVSASTHETEGNC
jgi:hypothetical protein